MSAAAAIELSASQEMYLKTILALQSEGRLVRLSEIAERLHVRKPSVTGALRQLSDKGLVNYAPYGAVSLTERGERSAREVAGRFEVLLNFLVDVLQIEKNKAYWAACDMEHALPKEVRERLVRFLEYMASCPRGPAAWRGAARGFVCARDKA